MKISDLARPPIQQVEVEHCDTAICPHHKGLIRETGDTEGTVFYCPIGRQWWRYSKQLSAFTAPLKYGKSGVV